MDRRNAFLSLPGVSPEEIAYLQPLTANFSDNEFRDFMAIYAGKRKKAQDILLFTLLGFIGIAGIQRFVVNQIAMGVVYFLTIGFCYIGTIVDLINHKSLTEEHNQRMAQEAAMLVGRAF